MNPECKYSGFYIVMLNMTAILCNRNNFQKNHPSGESFFGFIHNMTACLLTL